MGDNDASDTDTAAKDEEYCALEAIFGDSVHISREEALVEVYIPHPQGGTQEVILRASLPPTYPSAACPVVELYGGHLSDDVLSWAAKQLEQLFCPGEVVLYNWLEWLREAELLWAVPAAPPPQQQQHHGVEGSEEGAAEGAAGGGGASGRRPGGGGGAGREAVREAEVLEALRALGVTSGERYVEKKSTFQAHVAPVSSFTEVRAVMDALLAVSKVRAATHNIMAYRIHNGGAAGGGGGTFVQDYDDDGETAAGGRLLHLLQAADVRNVVVVVSRWFGGVLLGPSRFTAINNTARQLLEQLGHTAGAGGGGRQRAGGGKGGKGGSGVVEGSGSEQGGRRGGRRGH